jgi:hypothetical protein
MTVSTLQASTCTPILHFFALTFLYSSRLSSRTRTRSPDPAFQAGVDRLNMLCEEHPEAEDPEAEDMELNSGQLRKEQ